MVIIIYIYIYIFCKLDSAGFFFNIQYY